MAAVLVAALGFHVLAFLTYPPSDLYGYVRPWFRALAANGLAEPVGNYAPPYLYLLWALTLLDGLMYQILLIKLLSVFGAFWMAFAAARVLHALDAPRRLALLTLALPSVILNVSLLGQADTFWIAPCLFATAAAIEGRYARVALWCGLAFAVKAQAAVFAPFVIYLFAWNRVPLRIWALAPVAFIAAWTPAWVAGWPLSYLTTIYLGQADWMNADKTFFVGSGASLWTFFGFLAPQTAYDVRWLGLPLLLAGLAFYWRYLPRPTGRQMIMLAAIISAAGLPFLLPLVRERFFMLGDILAFLFAAAYPSQRTILLAVIVQVASAFPMLVFAYALQPWDVLAPLLMAVALLGYLRAIDRRDPTHSAKEGSGTPARATG
jgi:Gpi18-like mannosyltransferase